MLNVEILGLRQIQHDWTPATSESPLAIAVISAGLDSSWTRRILDGLLANHVKVTITELHGERLKFSKTPLLPIWGKATRTVITVDGITTSETKWDRSAPEFSGHNERNGTRILLETDRGFQSRYV